MRPDDSQVEAFVAQSMVVLLATRSRTGVPSLTPIWFVTDAGRFLMGTGAAALAVRNIAANPEVVLLFYAERAAGVGGVLRMRGRATCHRRLPAPRQMLRWATKYYLTPGGLRCELAHWRQWRLRHRYYAQAEAATIEVTPESAEFLPRVACMNERTAVDGREDEDV